VKVPVHCDESQPPRNNRPSRKTVLVVEDEAFVRESTCEVLQSAGYRVLQAGDAAEARAVFCNSGTPVDLLLCDAVLPDENGISLARVLRWQSPGLRTLMASGYPRSVLQDQFEVSDKRQVLSKPYSASLLLAEVDALLRRFASCTRTLQTPSSRFAKGAVKPGGMYCTTTTGTGKSPGRAVRMSSRALGPPVERRLQ
jgi:DNA-binding response OmpR family regulator